MTKGSLDVEIYCSFLKWLSFFLYAIKASKARITPNATMVIPTTDEYAFDWGSGVFSSNDSCFRNKENFTMTNPNPIRAMPVLIHARNVRSLARCSLDLSIWFVPFLMLYFANFKHILFH